MVYGQKNNFERIFMMHSMECITIMWWLGISCIPEEYLKIQDVV